MKAILRLNFATAIPGGIEMCVNVEGDMSRDRDGRLVCRVTLPGSVVMPFHALDVPIRVGDGEVGEPSGRPEPRRGEAMKHITTPPMPETVRQQKARITRQKHERDVWEFRRRKTIGLLLDAVVRLWGIGALRVGAPTNAGG